LVTSYPITQSLTALWIQLNHSYRRNQLLIEKDIDIAAFKENLNSSELMQDSTANSADLDFIAEKYNFPLSKLLDEHAPIRTKVVANRPRLPWFNSDIRSAITARRRVERKWGSSKQPDYLAEFKKAKNYATMLMNKARSLYLTNLINENSYDQHKLLKTVNSLLSDLNRYYCLQTSILKSLPITLGTTLFRRSMTSIII